MKKLCFLLIITVSLISENASAFNTEKTHPELTEKAIENSNVDACLIDNLNFPQGTGTSLNGLSIKRWLIKGSQLEDDPMCRASNHFHDPLMSWTHSYMSDQPWWLDVYCSSGEYSKENIKSGIHWATGYTEPAPNGAKPELRGT